MVTGLVALLVGVIWLVARPDLLATYHYNQYVIAATHLFVLGWICSIVMGAMYQLVPVALETKLYSERLAKWQFAFHLIGFVGMVWMFNVWNMKQVGHFGSVMAVGVGLFVLQHRANAAARAEVERHRHRGNGRVVLDFAHDHRRTLHRHGEMHLRIHGGAGDRWRSANGGERAAVTRGLHVAL